MPGAAPAATAVTMGEPAGIGIEIALKAWQARRTDDLAPFFLIADPDHVARTARDLGIAAEPAPIAQAGDATAVFAAALPVLPQALDGPVRPGTPAAAHAGAVIAAIERAVALAQSGDADAVVTGPIHKATLAMAGFPHAGHTEFLGHLAGRVHPVMMLVSPQLRVVPVTVHVSLKEALASLSSAAIVATGEIVARALREDFGIAAPRLMVTGLNPHAGEAGVLGDEEERIVAPAIAALRARGIDATGPRSADTAFHAAARREYDAALCMYHDQALIPLKTLDFERGVNVTLGLPFVRTSPDHGTALDIAGQGKADPRSMVEAIRLAQAVARERRRKAHAAVAG